MSPLLRSFVNKESANLEYVYAGDDYRSSSSSDEEEEEEVEFAFPSQGQDDVDLFANGQGHPVYPVFDRSLLQDGGGEVVDLPSSFREVPVEEREKSDSSGSDPADIYCVWNPQMAGPPLGKKSPSMGTSSSRKWKLMDLMVGRSRSDGNEKFLFLAPPNPTVTPERKKTVLKKVVREMDMKTAYKLYYSKGGAGDRKQPSYLPYRRALVGFHPF